MGNEDMREADAEGRGEKGATGKDAHIRYHVVFS